MDNIVSVKDLVREYTSVNGVLKREKKKIRALNSVTFDVKKGEVFGLLGQNGAGKTTLIKILTTLLAPTSGSAKVLGYETFGQEKQLRPYINFIFGGERNLYWRLTARDNLTYFCDLYKIDKVTRERRIKELLEMVNLSDRADDRVETFSKGMKQRLQIARGLVNDPEIIFLDEPTIGLDPVGARDLRDIIRSLSQKGKTVLLTTHYMYEADELCDRIAIINKGDLICLDTPENLKKRNSNVSVMEIKVSAIEDEKVNSLKKLSCIHNVIIKQQDEMKLIELQCNDLAIAAQDIMQILKGVRIAEIHTRETTLEDTYLKLVGDNK